MSQSPPIMSFFTGAGLFDIGFEQAGFEIAWTNEKCCVAADLYSQGLTSWRRSRRRPNSASSRITVIGDIRKADLQAARHATLRKYTSQRFGVIGGPPCPDFSIGGLNGGANGQSGRLFDVFVEAIIALSPSFFVIENVPGLVRTRKHRYHLEHCLAKLREQGEFVVDWTVINGLELGIPQNRERMFIVGFDRNWILSQYREAFEAKVTEWFTWPRRKYPEAAELPWPTVSPFGSRPSRPKAIPIELTVYPVLSCSNDPERIANGLEWFQPYSAKFRKRNEGDVSNKSFKRLHRYRYSPTAWYGNNEVHLHPWKARRLSVREALRIQTVPDSYEWDVDVPLSAKFRAIGNGVPCEMARLMALAIASFSLRWVLMKQTVLFACRILRA